MHEVAQKTAGQARSGLLAVSREFLRILYFRFLELPGNVRQAAMLGFDLVAIPLTLMLAISLQGNGEGAAFGPRQGLAAALTMGCSALVFLRLGLYRAVVRFMGHEALVAVLKGVTISTAALCAAMVLCGAQPAPTLPVLYWALMLVCVGGTRLALRSWYRSTRRRGERPVAIYGAGAAGRQLLTALRHSEHYVPVVFVDDAPRLQGRVVSGVPVISAFALADMIERHEVAEVFLAIASASPARRREIIRALAEFPVQVRSIPRLEDLLSGRASITQVEEISLADLLGREPVRPRHELVGPCIAGKAVMVTGAGGSIGSELCRQLLAEEPALLLLVESSEYALYAVERELAALIERKGSSARLLPVLGNVRDTAHMTRLLRRFGVQTIYHAAAYKHVPLVEYNVVEGLRNNTLGTLSLARAASAAGVETFVLVSTDKAVRPVNAMGASKRIAELVMQAFASERPLTRFVIVRFGNVIGSSGSVIPLFREQIAQGGPVTVTHELAERYFMTIPEAAQLVLQAGAMGEGGEVFLLEMGQPIRIVDLARRMIHLSGFEVRGDGAAGSGIEIRLVGLRPGEKLREELLSGGRISDTEHPMIRRAHEDSLPWRQLAPLLEQLENACESFDRAALSGVLAALIRDYDAGGHDELLQPEPETAVPGADARPGLRLLRGL